MSHSPTSIFRRKLSLGPKLTHSPLSPPPPLQIPSKPILSTQISDSPLTAGFALASGLPIPSSPPDSHEHYHHHEHNHHHHHGEYANESSELGQDSTREDDTERFDSVGSRAPLKQNYNRGSKVDPINEDRAETVSSFAFLNDELDNDSVLRQRINPPPTKQATTPNRIPPEGIHDPYVSKFLTPLDTVPTRPALLVRSSSMPGVPPSSGLLPNSEDVEVQETEEEMEGKLIFDVFDAQFEHGAEGMAKILKAHLGEVLKMQEQVGKLHLDLEGLDSSSLPDTEDGGNVNRLERREKGVEDIMQQLGSLSDELRKYHAMGTPKLSFMNQPAHSHSDTSTTPNKERSQSQSVDASGRSKSPRRSPKTPRTANPTTPEKTIPRAQSNLDKLTAGLNINVPEGPNHNERGSDRLHASHQITTHHEDTLAQTAAKRSLAKAWNKDAHEKNPDETKWVENMKKGLGSP